MESLEINKNIYGVNPNYPVFGRFTGYRHTNPAVKTPEIKDTFERTNPSNDGKFSFKEFGKNVAKGVGKFFTDIYDNIVKNPLITIPAIAVAGAMAATPVGLAFLAGGGIFASIFSAAFIGIKATSNISDKKWDNLEKQGKDLGKLIPGAILSGVAAVKSIRMIEKAGGITKNFSGIGRSIGKAGEINAFIMSIFKNIAKAPFRIFSPKMKQADGGVFFGALKKDWGNFITGTGKKGFFNPVLNEKTFTQGEKTILGNILDKPFSSQGTGFIDFTYGLGRAHKSKNFLQASIPALRCQAGE